jgi:hypothetical protein
VSLSADHRNSAVRISLIGMELVPFQSMQVTHDECPRCPLTLSVKDTFHRRQSRTNSSKLHTFPRSQQNGEDEQQETNCVGVRRGVLVDRHEWGRQMDGVQRDCRGDSDHCQHRNDNSEQTPGLGSPWERESDMSGSLSVAIELLRRQRPEMSTISDILSQ